MGALTKLGQPEDHRRGDELVCSLLRELGYGKGVEAFLGLSRDR